MTGADFFVNSVTCFRSRRVVTERSLPASRRVGASQSHSSIHDSQSVCNAAAQTTLALQDPSASVCEARRFDNGGGIVCCTDKQILQLRWKLCLPALRARLRFVRDDERRIVLNPLEVAQIQAVPLGELRKAARVRGRMLRLLEGSGLRLPEGSYSAIVEKRHRGFGGGSTNFQLLPEQHGFLCW